MLRRTLLHGSVRTWCTSATRVAALPSSLLLLLHRSNARRHASTRSHTSPFSTAATTTTTARTTTATTALSAALCTPRRCNSSSSSDSGSNADMASDDVIQTNAQRAGSGEAAAAAVSFEHVWALWNEGNLFSLSVAQMQSFLRGAGVAIDGVAPKKANLVRLLEEHLHARDAAAAAAAASSSSVAAADPSGRTASASAAAATAPVASVAAGGASRPDGYGRWAGGGAAAAAAGSAAAAAAAKDGPSLPPDTLLDLAQSGFYEGAANMAPKAFQLLIEGSAADMVVSRVNTTAFPGFPANTECYTLVAADAEVALRARFSKVLQWCALNMSSLHMDAELHVGFGTLLLHPRAARGPAAAASGGGGASSSSSSLVPAMPPIGAPVSEIVSSYTLQQRLQMHRPYTFVAAVPEAARAAAAAFLAREHFTCVSPPPQRTQLTYEGVIQRAHDERLYVELDEHAKLRTLHREWVDVQTVYHTNARGPDVRLLLRSRPPVRQHDVQTYASVPIVQLSDDDVVDVLPAEHGQLLYLSENETTRYECLSARGTVLVMTEVRRQPLIVLHDDEEDERLEYTLQVAMPAGAVGQTNDARSVGLEVLELARRFAAAVAEPYMAEYGCGVPRASGSGSGGSDASHEGAATAAQQAA